MQDGLPIFAAGDAGIPSRVPSLLESNVANARSRLAKGSVRWLQDSMAAPNLKSWQISYRRIYERFRSQHGAKNIAAIQTVHVNSLIDEMADRPAAAKIFRLRLKALMDFAVGAGYRADNPVVNAKRVKHRDKGIRPWTEQDIADFRARWPVSSPQRIAFEILLHTGLRRSDAVRLGRQHLRRYRPQELGRSAGVRSRPRSDFAGK
jgi:integrase